MDSLSCPAGTGMWRIKMKIKKPSHIIKGGGFRVSKIMFHLRTQIQIPSNQHGSIGRFLILLVRIALVTVTDLGRGGAAGGVDGAAFGTYRGSQGHCGGENRGMSRMRPCCKRSLHAPVRGHELWRRKPVVKYEMQI